MFETLWALIKAAFINAVKDKVTDMTKEEAKAFLDKIGVKVDEITDEIAAEVDEWKSGLDAETRRAVRPYWITIAVITFVLGCGVGHYFF